METLSKSITGIFICLLSIFVMSHNVSAITSGGFIPDTAIGTFWVSKVNNDNQSVGVCNDGNTTIYTKNIYTGLASDRLDQANQDYLVAIPFFNPQNNNSLDTKMPIQWRVNYDSYIWVKETEIIQSSNTESVLYMIIHVENVVNSGYIYFYSQDYIIMPPGECLGNTGWFTRIQWQGIKDYSIQIQNLNNAIQNLNQSMPSQQSINNINNSIQELNSAVEEKNEQEQEAYDNISNQSPEDLQGDTDNEASTNLIGLFQSFISALTNITQANNCNLSLDFPSYAGGTVNVNVCQNKDKGGNLVAIFSSLTLIIFYIPLALKLLSMIYNEIRSFTDG